MKDIYKFLLKQHIGDPCKPIVSIDQYVKEGEKIAICDSLGADIHSSVCGDVIEISDTYILIKKNNSDCKKISLNKNENPIEFLKEAGIVGMGGAGFPTYKKLDVNLKDGFIIANAAECEPLLSHNINQIILEPQKIYRGILYAMRITNASKGFLAIKKKNKDAIDSFSKILKKDDVIQIKELDDLYPMGEERALIRETLDILLDVDKLPLEANCIVLNVETLAKICEAFEEKKPVTSKNITVLGKLKSGTQAHVLMNVPIGTKISAILENFGGTEDNFGEIIMGGPFMGHRATLDDVITKTTGGIIVTMEFMRENRNLGLLVCACGANEERLKQIAQSMHANVVGIEYCKQAIKVGKTYKCQNPGNCPGQAEKILALRRQGAQALLISNCSDCTNTVMCVAPKLNIAVYHCTDHVMRSVGSKLIRKL